MIKKFVFDKGNDELIANSYVVGVKNKQCILIDCGKCDQKLIDYIKTNHSSCYGVLLTHGHFDHISGLEEFLKIYPCTLFIHRDDEILLSNTRLNCSYNYKKKISLDYQNIYLLDDEDEINFNDNLLFKVIHTPFHTKGSVCYLYQNENALFSGDTLFKGSIGRSDLPSSTNKHIEESLNKLKKLDSNLNVYPGHGENTTLNLENKTNILYIKGGKI